MNVMPLSIFTVLCIQLQKLSDANLEVVRLIPKDEGVSPALYEALVRSQAEQENMRGILAAVAEEIQKVPDVRKTVH